MKKLKLFITLFACGLGYASHAQVAITVEESVEIPPNTIYLINSLDKGVILPRLTSVEREQLSSNPLDTPNGLIVFDTTLNCLMYWDLGDQRWKGHCSKGNPMNKSTSKKKNVANTSLASSTRKNP